MEKRRILIVDDDLEAPRLMKRLLERRGPYEVALEHNGRNAVNTALAFKPELALLDVIMPDLSGTDVARLLHEQPEMRELQIVFISAVAEPIPGYPFLSKPTPIEEIIACIEKKLPPA